MHFTRRTRARTGRVLAAVSLAVAASVTLVPPSAGAAAPSFRGTLIKGQAYGAQAQLTASSPLPVVSEGKVAWQVFPCIPASGQTYTNQGQLSALNLPVQLGPLPLPVPSTSAVLSTGTAVDSGTATYDASQADATESSTIQSVSVLGGLIQATVLKAQAHSTLDATGLDHHSTVDQYNGGEDGSTGITFASLTVNGQTITGPVAPNTTIDLAPLGVKVVLNEQTLSPFTVKAANGTVSRGITVTAIHVIVTDLLGYSGSIEVATANTELRPSVANLEGYAFTASASAPPVISVGRQNIDYLPCAGTGGVPESQSTPAVTIPNLVSTGTGTDTVNGLRGLTSYSRSKAQAQTVNLLNGLITADVITSAANTAGPMGGPLTSDFLGTQFVNLVVNGQPIAGTVGPNTVINLPGLGSVTLNKQGCKSDRAATPTSCTGDHYSMALNTAIFVKITVPNNSLGLPTGLVIRVVEAESAIVS